MMFQVIGRTCAALILSIVGAHGADSVAGRWEGYAQIPGREMRVVVDLAPDGAGAWTGSSVLPGYGIKGAPLAELKVQSANVSFTVPGALGGLTVAATLSADGTMSGELRQAGNTSRLALRRTGPAQVDLPRGSTAVPKDVEGEWKGEYELLGYPRQVTLKLTNMAGAAAKADLVIVGKRVNNLAVDVVVMEGDYLTLESRAVQMTIELKYRRDAGEWKGTVLQGPFEAALTLRRKP